MASEKMAGTKLDSYSNGTKHLVSKESRPEPVRLWRKVQINEWSFSFLLFAVSMSIVLGKLYVNYGASDFNAKQLAAVNGKFVNISSQYFDIVVNAMISFFQMYGWLIRAAVCGLVMTGFSWYIIYKDSSIPGINPPSPFSSSKQRFPKAPGVQINYSIGVLNGILIFVYMCL